MRNLSFSAHADAKGIMQLIRQSGAKNVMLVHGEKLKMQVLKQRIMRELGIACYDPPNGMTIHVAISHHIPVDISKRLLIDYQTKLEENSIHDSDELWTSSSSTVASRKRLRYPEDNEKSLDFQLPIRGVILHEPGKVNINYL